MDCLGVIYSKKNSEKVKQLFLYHINVKKNVCKLKKTAEKLFKNYLKLKITD